MWKSLDKALCVEIIW